MARKGAILGLLVTVSMPAIVLAGSLSDDVAGVGASAFDQLGSNACRRVGAALNSKDCKDARKSFSETGKRLTHGVASIISTLSSEAADFPATSTTPGLSYRYNVELGAFERVRGTLGPVYTERATTLGGGKFDLGFGYSYIRFSTLNGDDLEDALSGVAFRHLRLDTSEFDLAHHVFTFSGTYGISDDLDVNLLVPLFYTTLKFVTKAMLTFPGPNNRFHIFNGVAGSGATASSAFGVGDIFVRTKYHFGDLVDTRLAAGLVLRLPSGDKDNFQGRGRTTVTPSIIASRVWGRFEGHTNVGVEADPKSDASRGRYEIGGVFDVVESLAVFGDVVGNSTFTSRKEEGFPIPREDIVDWITGLKFLLGQRGIAYLALRGPITNDGLRPAVIPSAGVDMVF